MTFREGLAATRDCVLPWFSATVAAFTGRAVLLVGLLAVGAMAVLWWPAWWLALHDRVTPRYDGQIIVNSPSVYTRQRLVNDRLAQSAWLQEQLRVTTREFDSAFRSIDEIRTVRNSSSLRGQIGVGGSAGGSATPTATSAPADEPKNDAAVSAVAPTSADLFRAKNTYREEVRAEIMETQLDDRHDIQGNTIYRLSFDTTVLAGTRGDALAVIKVTMRHELMEAEGRITPLDHEYFQLYEDWLGFMQKTVQNSVTNITQTLYERAPNSRVAQALPIFLLKRICEYMHTGRGEATCNPVAHPDNGTAALQRASKRVSEFTAAYLAARKAKFQNQLRLNIITAAKQENEERLKKSKKELLPEMFLYAFDESYQACEQSQKGEFYKPALDTGEPLKVQCPRVNQPTEGIIGATILYDAFATNLPKTTVEAEQLFSRLLADIKLQCAGSENAKCNLPDATKDAVRCLTADYMWSELNLHDRTSGQDFKFSSGQRFDRYFRIHIVGRETGLCNVIFLAKERGEDGVDPITEMRRDLNRGVEVYAYSITPKNLAQRVSTATDTRDAMQALLNANFGAGGRDVSSLIETLQKKSIQSQAIQSLPIVVGYGLAPAVVEKTPYTEFGWVIAPQIKIGTQNERSHSDRQYALAAVISVPSWWRSMNLEIETCWVDRADVHKKQHKGCETPGEVPAKHTVRLPGVISELSHKLGYDFVPEPHLEYRYPRDEPLKLEIGRPAQVLLIGGRIWRSTEVTLGAQKADEIAVLPNMEGILAKFRCVRRQANERGDEEVQKGAVVPIRVWTSEGVTGPEYAVLVEPIVTDEAKGKRVDLCPEERQEMQSLTNPKGSEPR
jgi:hypothetical protein